MYYHNSCIGQKSDTDLPGLKSVFLPGDYPGLSGPNKITKILIMGAEVTEMKRCDDRSRG